MQMTLTTLIDNLCFGEGPRWHDGRLYLSDMHAHEVLAVDTDGRRETVAHVPHQPSGLGWLPDGRLLIVSMTDRALLRQDGAALTRVADLSALAGFHCNDMVVDAHGNAYIGNFGFDLFATPVVRSEAELILVRPDGHAEVVARDMQFPNGTVITPDGRTLVVGESLAGRLTAFDIREDGRLDNRRIWAELPERVVPDGICLDAEGAIWVASPTTDNCLRVVEGGRVTDTITCDRGAFACMLGGTDRRTLFIVTAKSSQPEECRAQRSSRVEYTRVAVAGAGLP
jgi:sugar lactone lactonase YvrE